MADKNVDQVEKTEQRPGSPYEAMNMEYECHTEKSLGRHPEIELFFAVEKKAVL